MYFISFYFENNDPLKDKDFFGDVGCDSLNLLKLNK